MTKRELELRIDDAKRLVRKSFFSSSAAASTPAEDFNFECYAHFRVFNEALVRGQVSFPAFRRDFEASVGPRLWRRTPLPPDDASPSSTLTANVRKALRTTDAVAGLLQEKGLVASWERSVPPDDDIEDFATEDFDLTYSLALNGDVTLNSQVSMSNVCCWFPVLCNHVRPCA